jgi:hypothetical protein
VDMENTILAFNDTDPTVDCGYAPVTFTCCDLFGNEHGNWVGCTAIQFGHNGNIELDPQFCYPGDVTLNVDSPCAPQHNPSCGLIGSQPVACPLAGVDGGVSGGVTSDLQVTPNPSSGACTIWYPASSGAETRIRIVDAAGRLVRAILGQRGSGRESVLWDGRNGAGEAVPSGVYFVRTEGQPGGGLHRGLEGGMGRVVVVSGGR